MAEQPQPESYTASTHDSASYRRWWWLIPVCIGCVVVGFRWWSTQLSDREARLVGTWHLTRTYTSETGESGFADHYYNFNADRTMTSWWINRETRGHASKIRSSRWRIRGTTPMILEIRKVRPLPERLMWGNSDSEAELIDITADTFTWQVTLAPEQLKRADSLPPEFPTDVNR